MSNRLKTFEQRELLDAYEHAKNGGQALHLFSGAFAGPSAPRVFRNQTTIAHMFDQDEPRLIATAKKFGVRVIKVEHRGTPRQHIDLCGRPLERAVELARQIEWEREHGLLEGMK